MDEQFWLSLQPADAERFDRLCRSFNGRQSAEYARQVGDHRQAGGQLTTTRISAPGLGPNPSAPSPHCRRKAIAFAWRGYISLWHTGVVAIRRFAPWAVICQFPQPHTAYPFCSLGKVDGTAWNLCPKQVTLACQCVNLQLSGITSSAAMLSALWSQASTADFSSLFPRSISLLDSCLCLYHFFSPPLCLSLSVSYFLFPALVLPPLFFYLCRRPKLIFWSKSTVWLPRPASRHCVGLPHWQALVPGNDLTYRGVLPKILHGQPCFCALLVPGNLQPLWNFSQRASIV